MLFQRMVHWHSNRRHTHLLACFSTRLTDILTAPRSEVDKYRAERRDFTGTLTWAGTTAGVQTSGRD